MSVTPHLLVGGQADGGMVDTAAALVRWSLTIVAAENAELAAAVVDEWVFHHQTTPVEAYY